ncbi:MAG: ATP-binding cassette domain-containing protein [Tannerellaceae bacterium]|nr:ATP-binding cassette domain-containing protein [Tannerellaceae bacterium]
MSIILKQISYIHPDQVPCFENLHLTVNTGDKLALTGRNGSGKSTLLQLIAGILKPAAGELFTSSPAWYIPQHTGQYNGLTVAQALSIDRKLTAFYKILEGDPSLALYETLNDDWTIEERAQEALEAWGLGHIRPAGSLQQLSGGEKSRLFLSALQLHKPEIILMDEPTNHLDLESREMVYRFVRSTSATLVVVSHDVTLLRLLPQTVELTEKGLTLYGGNFDFYKTEKEKQEQALLDTLEEQAKTLRQARKTARETAERRNRLDARGKKRSEKKGISRMGMNTLRDKAEKSTTRLKDIHETKIEELSHSLKDLYDKLPENRSLKVMLPSSTLPTGKVLFSASGVNIQFNKQPLWEQPINFKVLSGERIWLKGRNGSGKTTLLKIITGELTPTPGTVSRHTANLVYIDQEYSLLQPGRPVYEQAEQFNTGQLEEHEVKTLLARFLFTKEDWDRPCGRLSGGEKMRLLFCCLLIGNTPPDILLLDEPTNNLDITSTEIILTALKEYRGTLVIISHDPYFIEETGVTQIIDLTP